MPICPNTQIYVHKTENLTIKKISNQKPDLTIHSTHTVVEKKKKLQPKHTKRQFSTDLQQENYTKKIQEKDGILKEHIRLPSGEDEKRGKENPSQKRNETHDC